MCHHGATAFANEIRMRHVLSIANFGNSLHHVVGVFLKRIICGTLERSTRSIVIHRKPSTYIEVFQREAELPYLCIKPRALLHGLAHCENVRHLRADVKMQQPKAILPTLRAQQLNGGHQFSGVEAELCILTAAVRPLAGAAAEQTHPNAELRAHAFAFGHRDNPAQFVGLLHHQNHLPTEPRAHQCGADERVVFVAIANQQTPRFILQCQRGVQFRFTAHLEAKPVRPTGI